MAAVRRVYGALRLHFSGKAYVNYAGADLGEWGDAYFGANLARLRRVKRAYDPHGL